MCDNIKINLCVRPKPVPWNCCWSSLRTAQERCDMLCSTTALAMAESQLVMISNWDNFRCPTQCAAFYLCCSFFLSLWLQQLRLGLDAHTKFIAHFRCDFVPCQHSLTWTLFWREWGWGDGAKGEQEEDEGGWEEIKHQHKVCVCFFSG